MGGGNEGDGCGKCGSLIDCSLQESSDPSTQWRGKALSLILMANSILNSHQPRPARVLPNQAQVSQVPAQNQDADGMSMCTSTLTTTHVHSFTYLYQNLNYMYIYMYK